MSRVWRASSRTSDHGPGDFAPRVNETLARVVVANAPRFNNRHDEPCIPVELPAQSVAGTLTVTQVTRLVSEMAGGIRRGSHGLIAQRVELGTVLIATKNARPHGFFRGWLDSTSVHVSLAEEAMRLAHAFGDGHGRVDMNRVVEALAKHGPPKFEGVTLETLDRSDINKSLLRKTAIAMANGRRVPKAKGQKREFHVFDFAPEDATCVDAAAAERIGSLSPPAPGAGHPASGAFRSSADTSIRGGGPGSSRAPVVADSFAPAPRLGAHHGAGAGGGGGGLGAGGAGGGTPPAQRPRIVQLTLDDVYRLAAQARRIGELLDAGKVPERELRIVEEALRVALKAAESGEVRLVKDEQRLRT